MLVIFYKFDILSESTKRGFCHFWTKLIRTQTEYPIRRNPASRRFVRKDKPTYLVDTCMESDAGFVLLNAYFPAIIQIHLVKFNQSEAIA